MRWGMYTDEMMRGIGLPDGRYFTDLAGILLLI